MREAQPEAKAAKAEAVHAEAARVRMRDELVHRIHELVPSAKPVQIGRTLDCCSPDELQRLYHGGIEWRPIPSGQASDTDRTARHAWDSLLDSFGYVRDE